MFAIVILINWNLINLIGKADGDNGGEEDAKISPSQPFVNSAILISNSVQLSRFEVHGFYSHSTPNSYFCSAV